MYYKSYVFQHQKYVSDVLAALCHDKKYDTYGVYHPENSLSILNNIPEFVQDAKDNNLWDYIKGFGINVIDPGKNNFIHIDPWFDGFSRYRLIFPISGYKGSSVAFYESNTVPDQQIYINNHLDADKKFQYFTDEKSLKEITRVSTETPAAIDTQTLHSAQNPGTEIRIIAMIGLSKDYVLE